MTAFRKGDFLAVKCLDYWIVIYHGMTLLMSDIWNIHIRDIYFHIFEAFCWYIFLENGYIPGCFEKGIQIPSP